MYSKTSLEIMDLKGPDTVIRYCQNLLEPIQFLELKKKYLRIKGHIRWSEISITLVSARVKFYCTHFELRRKIFQLRICSAKCNRRV